MTRDEQAQREAPTACGSSRCVLTHSIQSFARSRALTGSLELCVRAPLARDLRKFLEGLPGAERVAHLDL